jgi:hypothetical protein
MWLAMHRDLKATRRIRLLFDHLASDLTTYVKSGRVVQDSRTTATRSD